MIHQEKLDRQIAKQEKMILANKEIVELLNKNIDGIIAKNVKKATAHFRSSDLEEEVSGPNSQQVHNLQTKLNTGTLSQFRRN